MYIISASTWLSTPGDSLQGKVCLAHPFSRVVLQFSRFIGGILQFSRVYCSFHVFERYTVVAQPFLWICKCCCSLRNFLKICKKTIFLSKLRLAISPSSLASISPDPNRCFRNLHYAPPTDRHRKIAPKLTEFELTDQNWHRVQNQITNLSNVVNPCSTTVLREVLKMKKLMILNMPGHNALNRSH